jgi:FKBP-type peptidyl-prolyl cis-trans isomerase FkpA
MRSTLLACALLSLSVPAFARDAERDEVEVSPAEGGDGIGVAPALRTEKERAAAFVSAAATESGAQTMRSGLVIRTIREGHGAYPGMENEVVVTYTGRLADGTVFDTTDGRGAARFPLERLVKCWGEGITQMREGETAVITCPSDLAYGDRGAGGKIPGGAALQFEVTLHEIVRDGR